jgi:hypothetical protein
MPKPHKNTPPAIIKKPTAVSERPSLGQTMKEGFGFGVGVSLAQNAVNGAMNGAINLFSVPKTSNPVENTKQTEYEKCMKYSSNDTDLCKTLLNN